MALTVTLAARGKNHLRYHVAYNGDANSGLTARITIEGAASPDVLTDAVDGGLLTKLARTFTDGYGQIPAGAISAGEAAALWESDWRSVQPAVEAQGGSLVQLPTAILQTVLRTLGGAFTALVAFTSVTGGGQAAIDLAVTAGGAASWYLDVFVPGSIAP